MHGFVGAVLVLVSQKLQNITREELKKDKRGDQNGFYMKNDFVS